MSTKGLNIAMTKQAYSEGWTDPCIWNNDSVLLNLLENYLPNNMCNGRINTQGLMATAILLCEGKLSDKISVFQDLIIKGHYSQKESQSMI